MKIGIVTEYYYPTLGGMQEHVHYFGRAAQKKGHEVLIITSSIKDVPEDSHRDHDVPVHRIGRGFPICVNGSISRITWDYRMGDKLEKLFAERAFDVIHVHAPITPTLPIVAITRSPTWTFGTFHTNFKDNFFLRLFKPVCQRLLDRLDGVIGVSPTAIQAISRFLKADYRVIPNGVDTDFFHPDVPPLPRFQDGCFHLLFVARMEPRSNFEHLIKAFSAASECRDDLRLIAVGDGPLRPTLERMVPVHLKDRVHFTGYVNSGRPALYASGDVLCLPTEIASFGITALEAMSSGRPVIANDIDGFRDVMTHGKEGLLVNTGDVSTFRDAILKLAEDRDLARELGRRGRETALSFSWDRVADRILDYYQEIQRGTRRSCPPA